MESKIGCIYCGQTDNLSKSDIIPDALTNDQIINSFVCREAHNSKFSDDFESYVIEKLTLVTDHLDIKSSKNRKYNLYTGTFKYDDVNFRVNVSSVMNLLPNHPISSTDGKAYFGTVEHLKKMQIVDEKRIERIDSNSEGYTVEVSFDSEVLFNLKMYRLIAKIAFEWYCLNNNIRRKISDFDPLINFITTGKGDNPITFICNPELYSQFQEQYSLGSHVLFSYIAENNSVNIVVNLFGLCAYNIRILDTPISCCPNNHLFHVSEIDSSKESFCHESLSEIKSFIMQSILSQENLKTMEKDGFEVDIVHFREQPIYHINYLMLNSIVQKGLNCINEPTQEAIALIRENFDYIMKHIPLTLPGLKRVAKVLKGVEEFNLEQLNTKQLLFIYCIYLAGNSTVKSFEELQGCIRNKIKNESWSKDIRNGLMSDNDYQKALENGILIVEGWVNKCDKTEKLSTGIKIKLGDND
ncbi:hypothetical protein NHG32_08225 [Aerococcaceae bacterium NML191219]|nr:hypothetical protein [Aerococcaceae bacterium NML191219]